MSKKEKAVSSVKAAITPYVKAFQDAVKLAENTALLVVAGFCFWSGLNHSFSAEWMKYVVVGSSVVVGLIAADTFLNRYRK